MKKMNLFCIVILGMALMYLSAQEVSQPKKFDLRTSYAQQEESLLISETDLNCHYFIKKSMDKDIIITGADTMDWHRLDHSDRDLMFINKGSNHGIRTNDVYMVIGKGQRVYNGVTGKKMGYYFVKKSLARVNCVYEDKATILLESGCHPVRVGDFLIPYKPEKPLIARKPIYTRCRLPQDRIEGNVVYNSIYNDFYRYQQGPWDLITVDLGMESLSRGDFLVFYRTYGKGLPYLIIGIGITIEPNSNNSTVKVIYATAPISIGIKAVVLKKEDLQYSTKRSLREVLYKGEEKVPIIEKLDSKEGRTPAEDEETLELNVLFDIDGRTLTDAYKKDMEKVEEFIKDKSEYIIIIRGYACSIGDEEYNLRLSKDRVDSIKKYLMDTYAIKEEFFETYHYGEKDSPFDNSTEEERRKNRMVNIQVIGK